MSLVVLLDAGPLGLLTNPNTSPEHVLCNAWLDSLIASGIPVVVPEIADFEVWRELLRAGKSRGLRRLDAITPRVSYAPITTTVMRQAAVFWAEARRRGQPTADPKALDADVILAAQAVGFTRPGQEPVVATTNIGHLAPFVDARYWPDIP